MENALVRNIDARDREPREVVGQLRRPGGFLSEKVREAARRIVEDVRDRGDAALLEYSERFDGVQSFLSAFLADTNVKLISVDTHVDRVQVLRFRPAMGHVRSEPLAASRPIG